MIQTKQTQIGKIPEEWEIISFGKIGEYKKGKKPKEMIEKFKESYLPYLSTDYLRINGKTKFAKISENIILVDDGEIIILWDGSNAGEIFIGKKGILSSTMVKIQLKKENINQRFLFYLLKTKQKYLGGKTRGTGVPHVDKNILENQSFFNLSGGRKPGEEDKEAFYRKGIIGDWKNYLTDTQNKEFCKKHEKLMQMLGYLKKEDFNE